MQMETELEAGDTLYKRGLRLLFGLCFDVAFCSVKAVDSDMC